LIVEGGMRPAARPEWPTPPPSSGGNQGTTVQAPRGTLRKWKPWKK